MLGFRNTMRHDLTARKPRGVLRFGNIMDTQSQEQPQKFYFTESDGSKTEIALERWMWEAYYKDGSSLTQFTQDGCFHQFKEIDLEKLEIFVMRHVEQPDRRFEIHVSEGMQPIHFYRNIRLNVGTEEETHIKLYCFGYRKTVEGRTVKSIFEIYPNDAVAIKDTDGREHLEQ